MLGFLDAESIIFGFMLSCMVGFLLASGTAAFFAGNFYTPPNDPSLLSNARYLLVMLIGGTIAGVSGSYLAATLAKQTAGTLPLYNTLAVGGCGLVLNLLALPIMKDLPKWYKLWGILLIMPASLLAGLLA
jgi:hypothetical protein